MDTTSSHTELTANFFHQQNGFQIVLKDILPVIKAVKPTKRRNTDVSVYKNYIFSSNIAILK